jgi:hypothetical protein
MTMVYVIGIVTVILAGAVLFASLECIDSYSQIGTGEEA